MKNHIFNDKNKFFDVKIFFLWYNCQPSSSVKHENVLIYTEDKQDRFPLPKKKHVSWVRH